MPQQDDVSITLDNEFRPHSYDSEPAIIFPDGQKEYWWHGVRVPDYVIVKPSEITAEKIQRETNTEVRRVMLEKYGFAKYLKNTKAQLIAEDRFGKLWRTEIPDDEALVMVEVLNSTPEPDGSIKTYFLRVPPTVTTPQAAIAWTFGLERGQYNPVFMS